MGRSLQSQLWFSPALIKLFKISKTVFSSKSFSPSKVYVMTDVKGKASL